ncbi:MAG: SDR family oxidoreductase [Gemmatimonadales bacterium]|nr:MAG: SDR family oxidoreductase [Gemmatimonadales bacterium]
MQVLIAGCGYVGTELARRLHAEGHKAWGLRRTPTDLPEGVEPIAADLLDPELSQHLPPAEMVVYAAASDAGTPEAYRAIYVDGVRNLVTQLHKRDGPPVKRFIFVSSTGVYGDADGGWVDEDTETEPDSFRGTEVLAGETVTLATPFPSLVLRLGGIYGPGRNRLLRMVAQGQVRCPGDGPIWSNRIHRDDAARALLHLLEIPNPKPVYLGIDDRPTPLCTVYREVARMLGVPEPTVDPARGRDRSNKRCSNRRLRDSGFTFQYPSFREGYGAMIAAGEAEG